MAREEIGCVQVLDLNSEWVVTLLTWEYRITRTVWVSIMGSVLIELG